MLLWLVETVVHVAMVSCDCCTWRLWYMLLWLVETAVHVAMISCDCGTCCYG